MLLIQILATLSAATLAHSVLGKDVSARRKRQLRILSVVLLLATAVLIVVRATEG